MRTPETSPASSLSEEPKPACEGKAAEANDLLLPREWYEQMLDSAVLQATGESPDNIEGLRSKMNEWLQDYLNPAKNAR